MQYMVSYDCMNVKLMMSYLIYYKVVLTSKCHVKRAKKKLKKEKTEKKRKKKEKKKNKKECSPCCHLWLCLRVRK